MVSRAQTTLAVREGCVEHDGARLAWRLVGQARRLPMLVFENGWSASFQQWTLLQPLLAPHTQLLFYDRAGIGGSAHGRGPVANRISSDLDALCRSLNLSRPMVVVGQSYGGLIAGLHGAQIPSRVCGMVQLDPTPELDDPLIDGQLALFRTIGAASVLIARLGLPNPLFAPLWEHFPKAEAEQLERLSYRSAASLRAALAELQLLASIRQAIRSQLGQRRQPRLVISAGSPSAASGWLARRLHNENKLRRTLAAMQAQHRKQVERGLGGSWELAAAHTHGGLVSSPDGAAFSATRILAFLQTLASPA
ncbi:alpha/beta fold hydrolase [Solimonas terrae]|uniref:Alpha/beta hydrolase n=1 Tax=Solimonas terrae TaxID=1396819 RepID=A0A6M2BLT6_9GAMM|nr:alpha/beta hydrolase [Solimonas terrae]NGY03241.1 alpha/beta hydrolase [Solimonas terrae]